MTSQQALEGFFDAVEESEEKSQALTESTAATFGIENGRDNPNLTLDESSFELIQCPTMMTTTDFFRAQQDEGLRHQYFDEVISMVGKKLRCEKVVCLNMLIHENAGPKVDSEQLHGMDDLYAFTKPQTSTSSRVTDEMAVSLAGKEHRYQRYTILSLWRFIEEEREENLGQYKQLALMDERSSVKPDDYVAREKREQRRPDGKSSVERYYTLNPRHASGHKWYYFPNMEMDSEAILMKQMDSDWSNPGRMCFRMGVPDPKHDIAGAPEYIGRKAAEVRMICFWENPPSGINSMPTLRDVLQQQQQQQTDRAGNHAQKGDRSSWLDKIMYGDGKVHEWLDKIESMSAGFMEGTEKMTLAGLVSRAASCQGGGGGSGAPLPLNLYGGNAPFGGNHKPEGYFGRYTKEYSDKYEDEYRRMYLPKFLEVVDSYPSWPPSSKSWARNQMLKFGHREVDRGIAEITCVIVDDSMGMVGTKNFPVSKKKKIIDFLIRNETYMYAAMGQWAPLAYEPAASMNAGPVKPIGHPPLEAAGQGEATTINGGARSMEYQAIAEGRDDQLPGRRMPPKPSIAGRRRRIKSKHAAGGGKMMIHSEGEEESTDASNEFNSNKLNNNHRSRRLHEEYSHVKERRLFEQRGLRSMDDDESTESYDEEESELLRYSSEQRDGAVVSSRRRRPGMYGGRREEVDEAAGGYKPRRTTPRRHDSPESPEYCTDSSPGSLTRYDEDKSLAYSMESRLMHASRGGYEEEGTGGESLGSSYTHFHQRESSFRDTRNPNHHRYDEEEEDDEEQPQTMYTYNVNAPYTKNPHHQHYGRQLAAWEEPSEPSL